MNIGRAIRIMRGEYTQKGIAQQTGVTSVYISNLENNHREPSMKWIKIFCTVTQKPVVELFILADMVDKYGI
jgi:DNA-binding XRE family transcriptional regulator